MSNKTFAVIFGIVFILVGILGFIPKLTPNGLLLNLFMVDPLHNSFHILTGIIALLVSGSSYYARWYFRIFGIIYLFLAVLGVMLGGNLAFMHFNHADDVFHLVVGAIAIYLGFGKLPVNRTNA